ncbi:hypothetical protein ELI_0437 [Eubacterium callanderi]|uniref:Uncharacterized protein n=1 Tax=Eubacterium callanderi TaxID=53442 RepID=E3GIG9_9FIRM|nr:hypothetical protein ELI_0437 [Eubacterium callanderi]
MWAEDWGNRLPAIKQRSTVSVYEKNHPKKVKKLYQDIFLMASYLIELIL